MSSGRKPTPSEILDVMDRLERDVARRHELLQGYAIFRACVDAGVVGDDSIDWVAQCMQQLAQEGLIAHGPVSVGIPEPMMWDGYWIQSAHDWRVLAPGRADVEVYRRIESGTSMTASPPLDAAASELHDVFICHASEDKSDVALPLSVALRERGWTVWIDKWELTVGDSLSASIDAGLAHCNFGVVILSPAFFAKQWPRRELAGLVAREVGEGMKVILPIWHEVDARHVAEHSPTLADKVGALTTRGIPHVAEEISRALERARHRGGTLSPDTPVLTALEPNDPLGRFSIPDTSAMRAQIVSEKQDYWQYLLFAGLLVDGLRNLELKWHDHELRLPRGTRREVDRSSGFDFLSQEANWLRTQLSVIPRILTPKTNEQAFGLSDRSGDAVRIEHLAHRLLGTYEAMLDWAAALRNANIPPVFVEAFEAAACMVDEPIEQMREFMSAWVEQIARTPEIATQADGPITIALSLNLKIGDEAVQRYIDAREKAE
jgi:hypothetical protein